VQRRSRLQSKTPLRRGTKGLTTTPIEPIGKRRLEAIDGGELPAKRRQRSLREGKGMSTTPMQQAKVRGLSCIVCAAVDNIDPAHLLSRSVCPEGRDDPRAVVPLCRRCHTLYDDGKLSILEHLEPYWRTELAYAVERFGLLSTLEFLTKQRWAPAPEGTAA
jgi:hypothetical protein